MIFPQGSHRDIPFHIAHHAVTDAFIFPGDAQGLQQGLAFRPVEFFLGPVDPAAAQAQGMGGQHQVPHDQGPVVHRRGPLFFRQDHQHSRCSVEGIEIRGPAADFTVQSAQPLHHGRIGNGQDDGILTAPSAGCIKAGFDDFPQVRFRYRVRFETADAPAHLHGFQYFIVHTIHSFFLSAVMIPYPTGSGPFCPEKFKTFSFDISHGI